MRIIQGEEYCLIKDVFEDTFVNKSSDFYKERIQTKRNFSDGLYPTGYWWDCLKNARKQTERFCFETLESKKAPLYIMWDSLSSDQIRIPDYWKYPKESCLELMPDEFFDLYETLPEDIYVFDQTFDWMIVLTHEDDGKRRYCLSVGE